MSMPRVARAAALSALCLVLDVASPARVATAPDSRQDEFRGACYCRASGELHCLGLLTQATCHKRCADELCDDWFWMERLTCWNWGYGG